MKKTLASVIALAAITSVAVAGTDYAGKEMKQTTTAAPEECWYGDTEWNVSLWGTYVFTGTDSNEVGPLEFFLGENHGDRYLQNDHAWGGGIDAKYFWHKYFGFGVEGYVLDADRTEFDFDSGRVPVLLKHDDDRAVGSVLGTFTLRWPIGCSRFAPYGLAGGGAIFGGGERDSVFFNTASGNFETHHSDSETKAIGQFGGGFEFRVTRHIGWINDFTWNVVDGSHNNFGMVRSGLNFAF
jgi:hypothetical protein